MSKVDRSGTLAGLLDFLEEAAAHPELNRTTVQSFRSAWHSVATELRLPMSTRIDKLEPDVLVNKFEGIRGPAFRSGVTYRARLRASRHLYEMMLADDPEWYRVARTRSPQTANPDNPEIDQRPVIEVAFPLRRGLDIKVEVPHGLTLEEADRITSFYRSFVIPGDAHAGQEKAPAT